MFTSAGIAQASPAVARDAATRRARTLADQALRIATALWFAVTVIGQWAFLWYLAGFYTRAIVIGHIEQWNRNKAIFKGYAPGDPAWNLYFGAHVVMAAVVTFGGTLQLIPQIRTGAAWFHRWNGRAFLVTALGGTLTGLWMTLVRRVGVTGANSPGVVANVLDAVLIIACAVLAWREARADRIGSHGRWALRLFLVSNGVWFLRLGLLGWYKLTGGIGLTDGLSGPVNFFFDFASYLVPLAILELYLRARKRGSARDKLAVAVGLLVGTLYMGVGIVALTSAHLRLL